MTSNSTETQVRFDSRESWLRGAVEALRPVFAEAGHPLPADVHVSVGFPVGTTAENTSILAQCWVRRVSEDGVNHIFISPILADTADVIGALIHELCHAVDDCEHGHTGRFVTIAREVGCDVSSPSQALPGAWLRALCITLAESLGLYPHAKLNIEIKGRRVIVPAGGTGSSGRPRRVSSGPAAQTARQLKVSCEVPTEEGTCGYTVRLSRKWLDLAVPQCPIHALEMTPEH